MKSRDRLSRILIGVGGVAMAVGAIDPLEGSLLILPGSGLVALGTFLGGAERRSRVYSVVVFCLVFFGVAALWGLSVAGGLGGPTGRSAWWGLLVLPYLIGWSMGMWGPVSPRWLVWLGLGVGLWYLAILAMAVRRAALVEPIGYVGTVIGIVGLLTIGGCVYRLTRGRGPAKRHLD